MILVALRTGMRHGELLALRWEDDQPGEALTNTTTWPNCVRGSLGAWNRTIALGVDAGMTLAAAVL